MNIKKIGSFLYNVWYWIVAIYGIVLVIAFILRVIFAFHGNILEAMK